MELANISKFLDLETAELGEEPVDRCSVVARGEHVVDVDADDDQLSALDLPLQARIGDALMEDGLENPSVDQLASETISLLIIHTSSS